MDRPKTFEEECQDLHNAWVRLCRELLRGFVRLHARVLRVLLWMDE